jgi:hypothetical protein
MSEQSPYCQEINSIVCATCPLRELPEEKWQVDGRQETPYDTAEALKDVIHEAVHPEYHGLLEDGEPVSRGLQGAHNNVVALFTEGMRSDGGFWPGDKPGEVILSSSGVVSPGHDWILPATAEVISEENFSSSATVVLTCIRRNIIHACMEGIKDAPPGATSPNISPLGQFADVNLGLAVLNALADEGSPDAMRAKLRDIYEAMDENSLRRLALGYDLKDVDRMSEAELQRTLRMMARYLDKEHTRNQDDY